MATVTGLTADRMRAIEASSVTSGLLDANGNLILKTRGGDNIDAGNVMPASETLLPVVENSPWGKTLATKQYADTAAGNALTSAKTYTDEGVVAAKGYADGLMSNVKSDKLTNGTHSLELSSTGVLSHRPSGSLALQFDSGGTMTVGRVPSNRLSMIALGTENINGLYYPGMYTQKSNISATTARGYPVARAGLLEVFDAPDGSLTYHRYTDYNGGTIYWRVWNGGWGVWRQLTDVRIATGIHLYEQNTHNAGTGRQGTINFPAGLFTSTPTVTATIDGSGRVFASVNTVTTSSFKYSIDNWSGGNASNGSLGLKLNWIAIQVV